MPGPPAIGGDMPGPPAIGDVGMPGFGDILGSHHRGDIPIPPFAGGVGLISWAFAKQPGSEILARGLVSENDPALLQLFIGLLAGGAIVQGFIDVADGVRGRRRPQVSDSLKQLAPVENISFFGINLLNSRVDSTNTLASQ